jgi:hypothetical protein
VVVDAVAVDAVVQYYHSNYYKFEVGRNVRTSRVECKQKVAARHFEAAKRKQTIAVL